MLASLCRNHFVVIGVGKVGYQVIRQLLEIARKSSWRSRWPAVRRSWASFSTRACR